MSISKKAGLSAFASLAILFIVGLFLAFNSAKAVTGEKVKRSTVYFYNNASTDLSDMKTAGNWGTSQNSAYQCGGTAEIPCSISVPDGISLQDHLNSFQDKSALVEAAGSREAAN